MEIKRHPLTPGVCMYCHITCHPERNMHQTCANTEFTKIRSLNRLKRQIAMEELRNRKKARQLGDSQ